MKRTTLAHIMTQRRHSLLGIALITTVMFAGCAQRPLHDATILERATAEAAQSEDLSPEQAILQAEGLLTQAQQEKLSYYSPVQMTRANESLKQARALNQKQNRDDTQVLKMALAAENYILDARENKARVEAELSDALTQRKVLEDLGAQKVYKERFRDVQDDLSDLIAMLEIGNTEKLAAEQQDLLRRMQALEIDTLIYQHLNEARHWLAKAKSEGADSYAESTFDNAEAAIGAAEKFIIAHYRDRESVKNEGLKALNAAQRAFFVGYEARRVVSLNRLEAERHALNVYSMLNRAYERATGQEQAPQKLLNAAYELAQQIENLTQKSGPAAVADTPPKAAPTNAPEAPVLANNPDKVLSIESSLSELKAPAPVEFIEMEPIRE